MPQQSGRRNGVSLYPFGYPWNLNDEIEAKLKKLQNLKEQGKISLNAPYVSLAESELEGLMR